MLKFLGSYASAYEEETSVDILKVFSDKTKAIKFAKHYVAKNMEYEERIVKTDEDDDEYKCLSIWVSSDKEFNKDSNFNDLNGYAVVVKPSIMKN